MITAAINKLKEQFDLDAIITLDFETYYGPGCSLRNKTYAQYLSHEDFRVHMLGYGWDDGEIVVANELDFIDVLRSIRERRKAGERIGIICQNTGFDGAIACWLYGTTFDMYFDTQLCSRLRYINHSASLKAQAERMFPEDEELRKGEDLVMSEGIHDLHEYGLYDAIAKYCAQDVNLTRRIMAKYVMEHPIPEMEYHMMHITLRGAIEPQFFIDQPMLLTVIEDEARKRDEALDAANACLKGLGLPEITAKELASPDKYPELLKTLGVNIPYKMSPKTFEMIPALGKTDPEYIKLQMSRPELIPIFNARTVVKSRIAESRAQRLIDTTNEINCEGLLPMFLNYHQAHTGRWSGGQKLNQQNLQRNSKHRLSLRAQVGYLIGVRDLSGIELRMNLWFCEQNDLLAEVDRDLYSMTASGIYGYEVNKKTHPDERQVGKVAELGLGYGMGWYTFQQTLAGGPMGMAPMFVADEFAKNTKRVYEETHPMIKHMWQFLNNVVIPTMADKNNKGCGCVMRFGRHSCVEVHYGKLVLPSGRELQYDGLHTQYREHARGVDIIHQYDDGTRNRFKQVIWKKLYGGLLLENIIQALARDVIAYHKMLTEQMLARNGWGWVIGSVHDEILAMLNTENADAAYDEIGVIMATPPTWCPDIPLASEGGVAEEYSK